MPITATETATTKGGTTVKGERKKAPTIRERFEGFLIETLDALEKSRNENVKAAMEDVFSILQATLGSSKFVPKAKGSSVGRGAFYQIFGTDPVVGTEISPAEVVEKTDGKLMLNEAVLKRWADPAKGVPYGKGATAVVVFYRRVKHNDGTIREAFYKLEEYKLAGTDDQGFDVGDETAEGEED